MARIYMIRHAKPAAGWGDDPDPGLDRTGHDQAAEAAGIMARNRPMPILSSPLKRTLETAAPLADLWKTPVVPAPAFAEIPSPPGMTLEARMDWLKTVMAGTWDQAGDDICQWRQDVVFGLSALWQDCVIFSHFVALNAAHSAATGQEGVLTFRPDHASITVFDNEGGQLRLITQGREVDTQIL